MAEDGAPFEWLPESFQNSVVKYDAMGDTGFVATVRTNAATKQEMVQWLSEFEQRTKTKWLVRSTFPSVQRLSFRMDYVCQHSAFNKHDTKRASKNCNCLAKLIQKVNTVTPRSKQNDPHIKDGLPGLIELRNVHSHSLKTATSLLHLPATAEVRQQFCKYFESGMGVTRAMKYHRSLLELRSDVSEEMLVDGSINPKYSSVRWWHQEWRRCGLEPQTDTAEVMEKQLESSCGELELTCIESMDVPGVPAELADGDDGRISFWQVVEKMSELDEQFESSPGAVAKMLERLNEITTATQWEAFLHT